MFEKVAQTRAQRDTKNGKRVRHANKDNFTAEKFAKMGPKEEQPNEK